MISPTFGTWGLSLMSQIKGLLLASLDSCKFCVWCFLERGKKHTGSCGSFPSSFFFFFLSSCLQAWNRRRKKQSHFIFFFQAENINHRKKLHVERENLMSRSISTQLKGKERGVVKRHSSDKEIFLRERLPFDFEPLWFFSFLDREEARSARS